jgi:hypothetical protein
MVRIEQSDVAVIRCLRTRVVILTRIPTVCASIDSLHVFPPVFTIRVFLAGQPKRLGVKLKDIAESWWFQHSLVSALLRAFASQPDRLQRVESCLSLTKLNVGSQSETAVKRRRLTGRNGPTAALAYARIFLAFPNFILPTSVTTAQ